MSIRNQRSSSIELLRIVAMLMIVASHFSVHGVRHVLDSVGKNAIWLDGTFLNKCFASLLSPGGEIGVAIFFVISGYFCIKKKSSSILRVALEVFFYSVLELFVFSLCYGGVF